MDINAIVNLLNTGDTTAHLAEAQAILAGCTVAQLKVINAHEDLIVHAYKSGKARMTADLLAGIGASLRSDAIMRNGGPAW